MSKTRVESLRKTLRRAARTVRETHPDLAGELRAAAKPVKPGGRQPGAGRPTVFDGPRRVLHLTVTEEAMTIIEAEQRDLEPEYGSAATIASAVESLVWKGAGKTPTNKKPPR